MKIVQQAHQDWLELDKAVSSQVSLNRHETRRVGENRDADNTGFDGLRLQVDISQHADNQVVGIGVVVSNNTNLQTTVWALKESSSGNQLLDYANAVRLALAKARQQA